MDDFLRTIFEQQERIREITDGPARYLEEQRSAFAEAQKLFGSSGVAEAAMRFGSIPRLPRFDVPQIPNVFTSLLASNEVLQNFSTAHSIAEMTGFLHEQKHLTEWHKMFGREADYGQTLAKQLDAISSYSLGAERLLAGLDFGQIGKVFSVSDQVRHELQSVTNLLGKHHADILSSLSVTAGQLVSVPPFVSELPSFDLYFHSEALRWITPFDDDAEIVTEPGLWREGLADAREFIEFALLDLNPALLEQYLGARNAAEMRGPDWWRHVAGSMRHLLTRVIDLCAPPDEVRLWVLNDAVEFKQKLRKDGTIEFGVRLTWLCNFIPIPAYPKGVRTQVQAANKILNVLANHHHEDELLDQERFLRLCSRAEVVIYHILKIWKARQQN